MKFDLMIISRCKTMLFNINRDTNIVSRLQGFCKIFFCGFRNWDEDIMSLEFKEVIKF